MHLSSKVLPSTRSDDSNDYSYSDASPIALAERGIAGSFDV